MQIAGKGKKKKKTDSALKPVLEFLLLEPLRE